MKEKPKRYGIYIDGKLIGECKPISEFDLYNYDQLREKLQEAIDEEDYETAAIIRDKLSMMRKLDVKILLPNDTSHP